MRQFTNVLILGLALSGSLVLAQQTPAKGSNARATFVTDVNDLEKKLVALANAVPQDKFGWRPGAGVRSFSEVYMHTALSNYYFIGALGLKPPAGPSESAEKTMTQKAQVLDALKTSMTALRQAVMNLSQAELGKPLKLEGQQTTNEGALIIIAGHMHEHLGQLVAYARMNGIAPPWS